MRDGTRLYADVVRPGAPGRFPALLSRTPYNKNPGLDENLNTGGPFGSNTSVVEAQQTVYHRSEQPSHVLLPVIPR